LPECLECLEKELRLKASDWLPGEAFDAALKAADEYHKNNPPLEEDVVLNADFSDLMGNKGPIQKYGDITRANMVKEHVSKAMASFITKGVPEELAADIYNVFIPLSE
jgi:hypothetical protein